MTHTNGAYPCQHEPATPNTAPRTAAPSADAGATPSTNGAASPATSSFAPNTTPDTTNARMLALQLSSRANSLYSSLLQPPDYTDMIAQCEQMQRNAAELMFCLTELRSQAILSRRRLLYTIDEDDAPTAWKPDPDRIHTDPQTGKRYRLNFSENK